MIRPTFAVSAAALIFIAPALGETRTYDVADFTGIDVSAGIDVSFSTGASHSVSVENAKGDFSDIVVDVKNGQLVLTRAKKNLGIGGWNKRQSYAVTVTAPRLDTVEASSGADANGSGLRGDKVSLSVSSGADIEVTDVEAVRVSLDSSSGSDLSVSGTCEQVSADSSSGSDIDARELRCLQADADASSGSDIEVFASQSVTAEASSGADVDVFGGPAVSDIDKSSGGSVSIKG